MKINLSNIERFCFIVLISFFLFCNPMVILRIFFHDTAGLLIGVICASVLVLLLFRMLLLGYKSRNYNGILVLFFGIYSMLRFIYAGAEWRWQLVGMIVFIFGAVSSCHVLDKNFQRSVLYALTLAIFANAIVIIFPPIAVTEGAYWINIMDINTPEDFIGGGRSLGILGARGMLSLLSVIVLAISIQMIINTRIWAWVFPLITSLFCGFMSGNRSFLFGFIAIIIMTIVLYKFNFRNILISTTMIFFIIICGYNVWSNTIYGDYMYERFFGDTLFEDLNVRLYSEHGIVDVIKNLWYNSFFGSVGVIPGTTNLATFVEKKWYQPHNSFIWIMASRGVIAGVLFIVWTIMATYGFWRLHLKQRIYASDFNSLPACVWLVAFVAGQFACIADPLLESPVMIFLLGMGVGLNNNYRFVWGKT